MVICTWIVRQVFSVEPEQIECVENRIRFPIEELIEHASAFRIQTELASIFRERGSDFLEDSARSRFGVSGRSDGPADHQIIRTGTNRF